MTRVVATLIVGIAVGLITTVGPLIFRQNFRPQLPLRSSPSSQRRTSVDSCASKRPYLLSSRPSFGRRVAAHVRELLRAPRAGPIRIHFRPSRWLSHKKSMEGGPHGN